MRMDSSRRGVGTGMAISYPRPHGRALGCGGVRTKGRGSPSVRASAERNARLRRRCERPIGVAHQSQNTCISKTEMPHAKWVGVCPTNDHVTQKLDVDGFSRVAELSCDVQIFAGVGDYRAAKVNHHGDAAGAFRDGGDGVKRCAARCADSPRPARQLPLKPVQRG